MSSINQKTQSSINQKTQQMMSLINQIQWTFKPNTPTQLIEQLSQIIRNWRSSGVEVFLSGFHSYFQGMEEKLILQIYKWLQSWKVRQFKNTHIKHYQNLIKQIIPIRFTRLKYLDISKSQITNIEAITWMDCPSLEKLRLKDNYITDLKCLHKTNFHKLEFLHFISNPVSSKYQFGFLSKMKYHHQQQHILPKILQQENQEKFYFYHLVKCEPVWQHSQNFYVGPYYQPFLQIAKRLFPHFSRSLKA